MSRAIDPMTIAIRDGVGARLLELGFERKSLRAYVKQTGIYTEWVHFRRHGEGDVTDTYGIFDNALQAFCDAAFAIPQPTGMAGETRPCHLGYEGRDHARSVIHHAVEAWRKARRPWRPLEYLIEYPETAHPYLQFISERGRWRDGGDPEGCGQAMLECWAAHIEPTRAELLAGDKTVARLLVAYAYGYPDFRLATAVYAGNIERAREILARYVERKTFAPDPKDVEQERRRNRWTRAQAEAHAAAIAENSRKHAAEIESLARRLGLYDAQPFGGPSEAAPLRATE